MPDELIIGATGADYVLTSLDVGRELYCRVTATNSVGNASVNALSVGPIAAAPEPPTNTLAPSIADIDPVEGETLTVVIGDWTGDAPIVHTYQWWKIDPGGGGTGEILTDEFGEALTDEFGEELTT